MSGLSKRNLERLIKKERELLEQKMNVCSENLTSGVLTYQPGGSCDNEDFAPEMSSASFSIVHENVNAQYNDPENNLSRKLKEWCIRFSPSKESFESLLCILQSENLNVSFNYESMVKRDNIVANAVAPGHYYHKDSKKELQNTELKTYVERKCQEITSVKDELNRKMAAMEEQNKRILDILATQGAMMNKLTESSQRIATFPINTIQELETLEQDINDENMHTYVQAVRKLIRGKGLSKNLGKLLGDDIIITYNYSGTHSKANFSDFTLINEVFKEAAQAENECDYSTEIRRGFKVSKINYFKKKCVAKKNLEQQQYLSSK